MEQELGNVNINIKTEQSLTEQIHDHCKAKAALQERVQAAQTALEDSRKEVAAIQGTKSIMVSKVRSNCFPFLVTNALTNSRWYFT